MGCSTSRHIRCRTTTQTPRYRNSTGLHTMYCSRNGLCTTRRTYILSNASPHTARDSRTGLLTTKRSRNGLCTIRHKCLLSVLDFAPPSNRISRMSRLRRDFGTTPLHRRYETLMNHQLRGKTLAFMVTDC